ncbi:hypothetical protein JW960_29365 [candidate division KSB1 bacterium]|nr:hypothetical protein [candidate division KSB1 bacterium]
MKIKICSFFLLAFTMPLIATAQTGISLGLGGYTAASRGIEALYWNPANLTVVDSKAPRLEIKLLGLNLGVGNNAFSYNNVTKYIGEGEPIYLTEQDKSDILDYIPDDGLGINLSAKLSAFSFRYRRFGIGIESHSYGSVTIPKDIYETVLSKLGQGNYDYSIDGEAFTTGKIKLSYGFPVLKDRYIPGLRKMLIEEISVGVSLAYLHGMGYYGVEKGVAMIDINENGILPAVDFMGKAAQLGEGFGMDLGLAAHTHDGWSYGMVFENLIGTINWKYGTEVTTSQLSFGSEPMFIFGNNQLSDADMDTVSSDSTYDIDGFSTRLPVDWRMGLAKDFGKVMLQFEYGKANHIGSLGFGSRLKLGFLVLSGSWKRTEGLNVWSTGFAFDFNYFYFDVGVSSRSGFSLAETKGLFIGTSLCVGM